MQSARENKVDFFVQLKDYPTTNRTELDLYCSSQRFADQLQNQYRVRAGKAKSVFFGETNVRYHLYEDLPVTNDSREYYLNGDEEGVFCFKQNLVDSYYGSMPKKPITILRGLKQNIGALWSVVVILFLLLTQYEWISRKKEYAFLLTQGESARRLYFKIVLPDSFWILLETGATCFLFSKITGFPLYLHCVKWTLPVLLATEWLLFLQLLKLDLKTVFRSDHHAGGVLLWSYGMHAIATVLAIVAVSMNCSVITQAVRFHQQKEEIDRFGKMNMYSLNYYVPETDPYERISSAEKDLVKTQRRIWKSTYEEGFPMALYHIGKSESKEVLVCSSGAKAYLSSKITTVDFSSFPKDTIVIFLPDSKVQWSNEEADTKLYPFAHLAYGLKYDGVHEFSVIRYRDDVKLIGFGNDYGGSGLFRSPIILFMNYESFFPEDDMLETPDESEGTVVPYYLYNESPSEMEKKMEEGNRGGYKVVVSTTNIADNYYHYWGLMKHTMIIGIILSIVILFLVFCLTALIVRFELLSNGMELALKKLVGYHLWERYRRLFIQMTFSSLIGLLIAYFLNKAVLSVNAPFVIAGGLLIILVVHGCMLWAIRRHEKEDLVRILKRGAI